MNKKERAHLDKISRLGCIVCRMLGLGDTPCEIHHIRIGQGIGMRASNFNAIGLCPWHHRLGGHGEAIHAGQESWEKKFGTESELLTKTLEDVT